MYVDSNNDIYVLDSGNKRIVIVDSNLKLKKIIDRFVLPSGEVELNNPGGIFVTRDGEIYITDTENGRILGMDGNGTVSTVFSRPETDIFPEELEFLPTKVILDSTGTVYVLASGLYYGAIMYDQHGTFLGFYGPNQVETTAGLLSDYVWKQVMSKEQRDRMARYVPIEFTSFDIDVDDFIYTCTQTTRNSRNELKKLNPKGVNILRTEVRNARLNTADFGDVEKAWYRGARIDSQFVDIVVDEKGFINALDYQRGKVFQYDQESNLLFVFGGKGKQLGTFKAPGAVDSLKGQILILDEQKGNITFFRLSSFGKAVHKAVKLYNEGLYEEAVEPWKEVLKRNMNYELAYIGIAEALMKVEEYDAAMRYFNLGFDRAGYSEAFKEYRTETVRNRFTFIIIGVVLIVAVLVVFSRRRRIFRSAGFQPTGLRRSAPHPLAPLRSAGKHAAEKDAG